MNSHSSPFSFFVIQILCVHFLPPLFQHFLGHGFIPLAATVQPQIFHVLLILTLSVIPLIIRQLEGAGVQKIAKIIP